MCVVVTRQTVREARDLVDHPDSAAAVGGFIGLGEDSACNIGERNRQAPCAEVDPQHVTAFRAQFIQHRGPADTTARSADRANQSLLLKRVDNFRGGLFRQAGDLGEGGA